MDREFARFNSKGQQDVGGIRISTPKEWGTDHFSQVFNVLLNYWEIKPTQYESRLHELALKDIRTVSAFIPWSHAETDIYHSLKKFVRAAWSVRMSVRLFVMPELGVNYPNAGFPKDLLANISNLAVDRVGRVIYNHAAPNIFPLPSFSSPEVLKRFGNYLIKVGSVLSEVFTEVGNSDFCEIVVTNSLFNYYRSHGLKLAEHGDYSAAHVMAFRDFIDRDYNNDEQFKMQLYEGYNRHRFFTHIEKLLREKTDMVFSRKNTSCRVRHVDLFNPECEPAAAYQNILIELLDFHPSVQRYYEGIVAGGYRNEKIYLGNSGVFRRFNDQEKSFLMLAALIHSGEVSAMSEDFFKLSGNFHRKLRSLIDFLEERKFVRQTRVTYVSASKFSMEDRSFKMLESMASGVLSVIGGIDSHSKALSERLVFMDPKSIIRMVEFAQALSLAQAGKVVAIPMPLPLNTVPNYTSDVAPHLEKFKKARQPLRLNLGIAYEVYEYHLGHVVFYDPQSFWTNADISTDVLARFFQALMGLAEVRSLCSVTDPRIHVTSYVSAEDPSQRLLFVINPTSDPIEASLGFSDAVALAGLPQGGTVLPASGPEDSPIVGKTFELAVPPYGVLTMQLSDPSQSQIDAAQGSALWT